jgi:biotin carboxyl carrier protein
MNPQAEMFGRAVAKLEEVRRFNGPPPLFWRSLVEALTILCGARSGVILRKADGDAEEWQRIAGWPRGGVDDPLSQQFARLLPGLGRAAAEQGHAVKAVNGEPSGPAADCGIALRLAAEVPQETWVAAFLLPGCSAAQATAATTVLRLVQDTPAVYRLQRSARQTETALAQFRSVLDLMAMLNAQQRFMAMAMTLCNELASRHECDRVSLGWLEGDYVRLQAISHTEKFERKMEAIQTLEQTMEEALDQDQTVCWPAAEGDTRITRDHARYAEAHRVRFLCSVPLRLNGQPVGVLTCERSGGLFHEQEQQALELCGELTVRRLSELKRTDRWVGARLALGLREQLAKVVGVEHTWAKLVAVLVAVGLGILFFGKMNYRVRAPFILRTDSLAVLSAPFQGYIEKVPARIGDRVNAGQVLLQLDTRDLLLQEAGAAADLDRFTREAEKARATNALADMRIAQAEAEQARARLGLSRYRLSQAAITAPFAGVVVEGDLRKRIGAPVKQGETLFKVARTDRLYVECKVNETDIQDVRDTAAGQIAFASQPKLKFPVRIWRIEPLAQTSGKENVFIVRCHLAGPDQSWWRPGMSGVAKIAVGRRTIFWVLAHRTIDFLRMFFWW